MIRNFITPLFVGLFITTTSQAETILTKAQCLSDIEEVFRIIESVHPNPFAISSEQSVRALRADLEQNLPEQLERTHFFHRLAPIIATLRDGHTSLRLPMVDYVERCGHSAFPVDVAFEEESLIVVSDWSKSGLPKGTQLIRINGRDVSEIVNDLMPLQHAELRSARRLNVARYFRVYLALALDIRPPYKVSHIPMGQSQETHHTLVESSLSEINARRTNGTKSPPYSYEFHQEDHLGIIAYNLCRQDAAFDEFLRETFLQIRNDDLDALVIDLRQNGGGSARANVSLFSYVTDSRYRMFSGGDIKVSRFIKKKLGKKAFEDRFVPWDTPDGTIVSMRDEAPYFEPTTNELRYAGPLYVLSGVGTQSSGMNFVNAVKDYDLGIIVGEETGDPATAFGDLESFRLAQSGLEMYVSTKFFIRANGGLRRRGIQPDFRVSQHRDDTMAKRDTAIEFVKEHIRNN